jgi:hypothetical protein
MSSDYSNRELKIDLVVGTLVFTPLLFLLFDKWDVEFAAQTHQEQIQPLLKYLLFFSVAFVISSLMLVRREMTGKQLVGRSAGLACFVMCFGFITWLLLNATLDGIVSCPRGQLIVRPDSYVIRTVPHTHRRLFQCVSCNNPHATLDTGDQ